VLVICVGQAAGRAAIELERVAINVDDAPSADNAGKQPIDRPIERGGPAAYWSTLPIKSIQTALRRNGLPANVSLSAGTFVCNHVFYGLMHALRRKDGVRGGFVHVPILPQQAKKGMRSLSLPKTVRALEIVVRTSIRKGRAG
jgi:pyroglutamyl-peptidase